MPWTDFDLACMRRALDLAERGRGSVEPNPMVGCLLARDNREIAAGWHERFGGPHAEVMALKAAGSTDVRGCTAYVTLEPCCHHGKTPPCTDALIAAGVARVVAAMPDPFPAVSGAGLRRLAEAGVVVETGCLEAEARSLNDPYLKLLERKRPWVIAKWAMSLDGKIATRDGNSQWITNEASRAVVHRLRGRVDAIAVGIHTAETDDPLLTARPPGIRTPTRIVLDSLAMLPLQSRLVRTARETPVLVAVGPEASERNMNRLADAGCEVLPFAASTRYERMLQLLDELGRRRMTNVLVEGGSQVLGQLFDAREIDEAHVFIAPKLIGGDQALTALGGAGVSAMSLAARLEQAQTQTLDGDLYIHGRVSY
jgi:diaminohydroxyphosphoribosylaminopyrimidine deaminase/5-amino-6-(5-phosphoribosylamino)uracil reductase